MEVSIDDWKDIISDVESIGERIDAFAERIDDAEKKLKELAKGLGLDHFEVKRGAAAKPVIIENPTQWVRNQRQSARY